MKQCLLLTAVLPILGGASVPATELTVEIQRLRNQRGVLHLCLTASPKHFPDCRADPKALQQTVPARTTTVHLAGYPPGQYALTVFHDENNNRRLDTFLGVPREGFGFSRNPTIRFGPPRFAQVSVELGGGITRQSIRMQYLL